MIDPIKTTALNLEEARRALEEITPKFEAASEGVRVLESRIAEERAKQAKAVADYRAGVIDAGAAGVIQQASDLDIADLQKMLVPAKATLDGVGMIHSAAYDAARRADAAFAAAETKVSCDAFDAQIKEVELKLLSMLAHRYSMQFKYRNSLQGIWEPTKALKDAVDLYYVPSLRA